MTARREKERQTRTCTNEHRLALEETGRSREAADACFGNLLRGTCSGGELVYLAEVLQEAGEGSGLGGGGEGRGLHDPEMMAQAEERRKHPEKETR